MHVNTALAIARTCESLEDPTSAEQAASVLGRELDAREAYIAELLRHPGGIPPRYTSPNTVTRISRGLL